MGFRVGFLVLMMWMAGAMVGFGFHDTIIGFLR